MQRGGVHVGRGQGVVVAGIAVVGIVVVGIVVVEGRVVVEGEGVGQ